MQANIQRQMGHRRSSNWLAAAVAAVFLTTSSTLAQGTKQDDARVLETVHDFGQMTQLWNAGKYEEIESLYNRALQIEEEKFGKDYADLGKLLSDLALHYDHRGLSVKSEPLYRRALTIFEKTPNDNLDEQKTCLSGLGYAYVAKRQLPQAEQFLKRALAVEEKASSDPNEESLAMSLDSLAQVYTKEGKYAQAKVLLQRSLTMREHTYGANDRMVKLCLEKLAEVNQKMGNQKENVQLSTRVLAIKKKDYGPVLGPFFVKVDQQIRSSTHNCILPLSSEFAVGKPFDEKSFTRAIKMKLGDESPQWYKIPPWLAGLWQCRDIPANARTKEVDGAVWDDPAPTGFYEGPGPYAIRKGAVQTKDGWWERSSENSSDFWTRGGAEGEKCFEYSFCHRHPLATTNDGCVVFRQSVIFFRVNPTTRVNLDVLLPEGILVAVWQEDTEDIYGKVLNDQVARYTGTRIYGWSGQQLTEAPGDAARTAYESVALQKKLGKAAPIIYRGFDAKKSLKASLVKQKKLDELKLLDNTQ